MPKIKFNVPVQIQGADGKRQNLKPGIYELSDEIIEHWFVQGLISSGLASTKSVGFAKLNPAPIERAVQEKVSTILDGVVIEEIKTIEKTKSIRKKKRVVD